MDDACAYVIFGATGNLATTKLLPALYHLDQAGRLRPGMRIICSGRRPFAAEEWLAQVRDAVTAKARGGLDETLFWRTPGSTSGCASGWTKRARATSPSTCPSDPISMGA